MLTDDFTTLTAPLRTLGGGRVWSLMVSLFGDLAQNEGDVIDGPILSTIMARLQVKPEAARVALHRLRKDGWITSEKLGRIRQHSLTATGRQQSAAASPRIYADPHQNAADWHLILTETGSSEVSQDMADRGFTPLTSRLYIGSQRLSSPPSALKLHADSVPAWLRSQAQPTNLTGAYQDLRHTLEDLAGAVPCRVPLSALDTAVLRCLIVHNWRRLVLKHPALPAALIDPDWAGHQCHLLVWDLLARFPRPALHEITGAKAA